VRSRLDRVLERRDINPRPGRVALVNPASLNRFQEIENDHPAIVAHRDGVMASANPDRELLNALRPATATVPGSLIIGT
jgi:hypothetical protein